MPGVDWSLARAPQGGMLDALKAYQTGATMRQQQVERQRGEQARAAFSDYLAPRPVSGNPTPGIATIGMAGSTNPPAPDQSAPAPPNGRDEAFKRLADADPERAWKLRQEEGKQAGVDLDLESKINSAGIRLLGGVHDQTTWERAKSAAERLWAKHGHDLSAFELPDEYDPKVVQDLRLGALDLDKQFSVLLNKRRLEWDIQDDETDNARADRSTDSLIRDRGERTGIARERATDARVSATRRDATTQRGQDRRGSRRSPIKPTATGPNGEKMEFDGTAWVPAT